MGSLPAQEVTERPRDELLCQQGSSFSRKGSGLGTEVSRHRPSAIREAQSLRSRRRQLLLEHQQELMMAGQVQVQKTLCSPPPGTCLSIGSHLSSQDWPYTRSWSNCSCIRQPKAELMSLKRVVLNLFWGPGLGLNGISSSLVITCCGAPPSLSSPSFLSSPRSRLLLRTPELLLAGAGSTRQEIRRSSAPFWPPPFPLALTLSLFPVSSILKSFNKRLTESLKNPTPSLKASSEGGKGKSLLVGAAGCSCHCCWVLPPPPPPSNFPAVHNQVEENKEVWPVQTLLVLVGDDLGIQNPARERARTVALSQEGAGLYAVSGYSLYNLAVNAPGISKRSHTAGKLKTISFFFFFLFFSPEYKVLFVPQKTSKLVSNASLRHSTALYGTW